MATQTSFFGDYQSNLNPNYYENIFKLGEYNNKNFYNLFKTVIIPKELNPNIYDEYATKPNDTWTNISYTYYNNIDLWWLIALVNNVYNPFELPQTIKIIKPEYIELILNSIQLQLH